MLAAPSSELVAGAQAVVVAAFLLGLGYLVVDAFVGRRTMTEVARWGLALAGLCALSLLAMIVHMATSGGLFAHPEIVRVGLIVVAGTLFALRVARREGRDRRHVWIALGLVGASVLVWGTPVFRMMPLTATADTQLHSGWIDQLMAGETTPGATLTGDVPNYYPWLFHSVGALTTAITPGGTPYHSLAPLQLVQVAGAVLALFALGHALTERALTGFGAALLGGLGGGFGFVMLRGLDVIADPRAEDGTAALTYQGDLLFSRSYNIGFHNLAPPFPRDLAFGLLITFLLVLALRIRGPEGWVEVTAGVVLGLVGLTGGETFLVGAALALVVVLFDSRTRGATATRLFLPALALYALWIVPIAVAYARLDGFVSITHIIPVALPATAILVSWGLTTPFALAWLVTLGSVSRGSRAVRLCVMFVAVSGAMLAAAAIIPETLGDAFDTLGRKHRYWPILYLSIVLPAAVGFTAVVDRLRNRSRRLSAVAVALVTCVAVASPVVASIALPTHIGRYPEIGAALRSEPGSLLRQLRDEGPGCVVAAPQEIAREVFSFTGYRMVLWTGNWLGANRARIRWANIYEHIGSEEERVEDNRTLVSAAGTAEAWRATASRYDPDLIVIPADRRNEPALRGLQTIPTVYGPSDYVIVRIGDCGETAG
jgi:hypothetical protein